jgi:hypothetical protein
MNTSVADEVDMIAVFRMDRGDFNFVQFDSTTHTNENRYHGHGMRIKQKAVKVERF